VSSLQSDRTDADRWFALEVLPHEPSLRAYLRGKFPSLTDTDDLVQETYARLLRARETGGVRSAKALLFTTARNAAFDLFRRKRVVSIEGTAEIDELFVYDDSPGVAETICHEQELELLLDAVRALPDRCREVLTLRKIYGLSHKEIATRMGISERTVNAHVAIGLLRCRDFLRNRGVTGNSP
jgi:RNA polymerase sigma factor (sigma-70 family)